MKIIKLCLLSICLSCLLGCNQLSVSNPLNNGDSVNKLSENSTSILRQRFKSSNSSGLAETETPKIIKELNKQLEQYNPQVKIISPQAEQIVNQTDVTIQLQVDDLPLFQDEQYKLGNHLNLILDNEPARPIYNVDKPIILENLTPGTHTLRVFATRPWGESFKNDRAYAQTTFSVLTETNNNSPRPNLPLLTYNSPTGTYGAEPIMLDFYLNNAPLHSVAKNNSNVKDWGIKVTVNGTSFMLEDWQPIYLKGFNQGENWVQLELIDDAGNSIENTFNNTVRVINYDPKQIDFLSQLVSNKISLADAQLIVEPKSNIKSVETPEIIEPSRNTESETELKRNKITKAISPIEESDLEDNNQEEIKLEQSGAIATIQDNDSQSITSNQPVVIAAPEIRKIEEIDERNEAITPKEERETISPVESTELKTITITEDSPGASNPIAELQIPQPESVEIKEDEIAITIPSTDVISEPESTKSNSVWWKKLLVGLRQRLEGIVKKLPSEV